ncbi:ribosomal protein S10 [Eremomyces bilateralis CBS 781.70]|uniref:Small ribosomal subunit protein uS10m n=1 Tax=Eremomyces bilateralis CBS 781.70 TaxID=1392243 RepID=A0A6G1G1P7_9PEZI|nr:ribosomal protein S10 [Eremomyces bilateralis CBS 781.70]KAF1812035.1 ribosomal protein S10 [Eremomyces bilateralis CBS 781.70]
MPIPKNLQSLYFRPLRRAPKYGIPTCNLQLRSYNVRNLEFFADFAMRAAYYLDLAARGPVPLPRITERWTVPRSPFVHKKSQENFERVTVRRLIQIQDGHPDVVKTWLDYLQERAFHGVGMKANVWDYEKVDFTEGMDRQVELAKTVRKLEEAERTIEQGLAGLAQAEKNIKADPSVGGTLLKLLRQKQSLQFKREELRRLGTGQDVKDEARLKKRADSVDERLPKQIVTTKKDIEAARKAVPELKKKISALEATMKKLGDKVGTTSLETPQETGPSQEAVMAKVKELTEEIEGRK